MESHVYLQLTIGQSFLLNVLYLHWQQPYYFIQFSKFVNTVRNILNPSISQLFRDPKFFKSTVFSNDCSQLVIEHLNMHESYVHEILVINQ